MFKLFSILAALAAAAAGCATLPGAPKPEIQAVSGRVSDVAFDGTCVVFDITVHNPYPFAIRKAEFRYGIEIGGADFINSRASIGVDLPARKTSTLTLPICVSYRDLWDKYPGLRKAAETRYRLHAVVAFSVIGPSIEVPFSHEDVFPIFRPPIVTAAKVRLADVSLRKATVIVDAEIENPNVFPVDVSELEYELDLGEVQLAVISTSEEGSIGSDQTEWLTLTGYLSASEGLIKVLINGISKIPNVSTSGSVKTVYGPIRFQE